MLISGLTEELSSSATSSPLLSFMSISPTSLGSPYSPFFRQLKSDERGLFLIHLLLNCANHVSARNLHQANIFLEHISLLSSPEGDTMQRISSYFTESLAFRLLRSFPGLYRALNPSSLDLSSSLKARQIFLDICPFIRLSFLVCTQAILEAMEGEKVVHVIDFGCFDSAQWVGLLQGFACRPEGPPHLRITGVSEEKDCVLRMGSVLSKEAEKFDIPFQFNAVVSKLESVKVESLRVKTGEAVAICSVLKFHCLLGFEEGKVGGLDGDHGSESSSSGFGVAAAPKMEAFLASLWSLGPKIMVVVEQEGSHNGGCLNERFVEALNFYAAMFDCLESTLPRQSEERLVVEKRIFGEEIKNIIACEGIERKERHEKIEKWIMRFEMGGFGRVPLSYYGMVQARRMLQSFGCEGYRVKEENGCFLFCWQDRALFSVSAWKFRRFD